MKYLSVFLLSVFVLYSCKDKLESSPSNSEMESAYRYFPLVKGSYIIYDVDSIIHEYPDDNNDNPDSLVSYYHYQLKEMVDSSFIDGEGRIAWRISRHKRDADTLPWYDVNVWIATRTMVSAQRVEDNIRYVKLSFPMRIYSLWNGNAFNAFREEDYSYDGIDEPLSVGGFNFDSSATVIQLEDSNALHRIYKKEMYVSGIGMVFKQNDSLNVNGVNKITNGFQIRETLRDYFPR